MYAHNQSRPLAAPVRIDSDAASALQAELSRQASAAADAVSSSSSSLPDAVAEPLTALQDGVQGQASLLERLQQARLCTARLCRSSNSVPLTSLEESCCHDLRSSM